MAEGDVSTGRSIHFRRNLFAWEDEELERLKEKLHDAPPLRITIWILYYGLLITQYILSKVVIPTTLKVRFLGWLAWNDKL